MPYRFILPHSAVNKVKFQVDVAIYLIDNYIAVFVGIYSYVLREKDINKQSLCAF
jgi:hypothetical protein